MRLWRWLKYLWTGKRDQGRQFTTCPYCQLKTDIPTADRVVWVARCCSECEKPHVAPYAINSDEAGEYTDHELLLHSVDSMNEKERAENE